MKRITVLPVIALLILSLASVRETSGEVFNKGGLFHRKAKKPPIENYYIFYIDQYQVMENTMTNSIKQNVYLKLREDVNNVIMRGGKGLLYYSLSSPIFYYSLDSIDIFLQKVSQSHYELSGNRVEDFSRVIYSDSLNLSNKRVFFNVYLNSYNTYYTFIKQFLAYDIFKVSDLEVNRDNVNIKIYVPFYFMGHEKERYLFVYGKQPVLISNWTIINIL